ncbi:MAG: hypothetical protein ABI488_04320 [Polyangiaceae bacterium]
MRGSKRCLLVAALACLSTFRASNCAALTLTVEREPGTEACPDEAALTARVRAVRGSEAEGGSTAYVVRFKRTRKGLSAEIRVGEGSVRALNTNTASCHVLAKGVAVTLAMLIDSDAAAQPSHPPEAANAPAAPEPAETTVPPPSKAAPPLPSKTDPPLPSGAGRPLPSEASPSRAVRGLVAFGGAGLVGVLGPIDPAFTLEGGLRSGIFRVNLGVMWGFPRQLEVAAGSVTESLLAATLRVCSVVAGGERLSLAVCAGAFAGELGGDARGFADVERHHRPWLVLPVELSLARLGGPLGWELSAAALVPVVQRDFGVTDAGVAYRTPVLGGLLALRGVIGFGH